MIIVRLAVDQAQQGKKLGAALLKDALQRTLAAADIAGTRAVIVHAKDDTVCKFYERFGFVALPDHPLTM